MTSVETVLVVDDIPGARVLLAAAVRSILPHALVTEADGLAAARSCMDRPYQLALIDLGLPDGRGSALIAELKRGGVPMVAAVTVMDDDASIEEALAAGADGYLLKDAEPSLLALRIERLVAGEPALSPTVARRVLARFVRSEKELPAKDDVLSGREREVLSLVARGLRATEAAGILGISHHTVRDHLKSIYRKLDVSSRAEAALEARRRRLT